MKYKLLAILVLSVSVSICSAKSYPLIELGNDTENWMARATYRWARNRHLSPLEKAELDRYSIGENYQARQLSSLLLTKQHLREGKELSELPENIKTNLVQALRNDEINPRHPCNLPANGYAALSIMLQNKPSPDLMKLLYAELSGGDYQSANSSAEILIKWRDVTKPVDVRINQHLISALGDGRGSIGRHTFRIWELADELGKDNLIAIVSNGEKYTEFQCAVLQILCAKYDIDWSAPSEIIEEWKAVCNGDVEQWRSATFEEGGRFLRPTYMPDHYQSYLAIRIRQAALYLTPIITAESDQSTLPKRTRRLFETEGKLANAKSSKKHKWILSWFPLFPH